MNDVIVMVDGSGLFHAAKKHLGFKPNLKSLLTRVAGERKVQHSKVYIGLPPSVKNPDSVRHSLRRTYTEVDIWNYAADNAPGDRGTHTVKIVQDTLELAAAHPAADFVLVVGSSVYASLVLQLQEAGHNVEVAFVPDCLSHNLAGIADAAIPLRNEIAL